MPKIIYKLNIIDVNFYRQFFGNYFLNKLLSSPYFILKYLRKRILYAIFSLKFRARIIGIPTEFTLDTHHKSHKIGLVLNRDFCLRILYRFA